MRKILHKHIRKIATAVVVASLAIGCITLGQPVFATCPPPTTMNSQPYATYDANGNQLSGGGRTNVWDSQNRLVSCTYDNVTSAFTYGSDGLRRLMTVGNNPTVHYALDGQNVVQEGHLDQGDFVTDVTYLLGPRGIEYRKDTSGVSWYLYDGLGTVIGEVDATGSVTYTAKHDVYGAVRDSAGTSDSKNRFCGSLGHAQEDATGPTGSGLIYMRARWMDPVTGRFVSEDPASDGDNWYAYCGSNPVNKIDASGESALDVLDSVVGMWEAIFTAFGVQVPGSWEKVANAATLAVGLRDSLKATRAYGRFMLDYGKSGDVRGLTMAASSFGVTKGVSAILTFIVGYQLSMAIAMDEWWPE